MLFVSVRLADPNYNAANFIVSKAAGNDSEFSVRQMARAAAARAAVHGSSVHLVEAGIWPPLSLYLGSPFSDVSIFSERVFWISKLIGDTMEVSVKYGIHKCPDASCFPFVEHSRRVYQQVARLLAPPARARECCDA
jgi:hypothetical protein